MEAPECPVCLENYDGEGVIPRVLGCGHTACECCLSKLPERFPQTVRCPACTQLVKFPSQGPSSLPKNIDLLSLSFPKPFTSSSSPSKTPDFLPPFWSHHLYSSWASRILPSPAPQGRPLSLVALAPLPDLTTASSFEFSYVVRVVACLSRMPENERLVLDSIFTASSTNVTRVYGLCGDSHGHNGFLHLVCERMGQIGLEMVQDLRDHLCAFAAFAVDVVEAVMGLNSCGLVAGFSGLSCFGFDKFGHASIDIGEVLVTGRRVRKSLADGGSVGDLFREGIFVSPETLRELLGPLKSRRSLVGFGSDTWSVACLLISLLVGQEFTEEFPNLIDGDGYSTWIERVGSLLDSQLCSDYIPVKDTLMKCLDDDPRNRPHLNEVRRTMRELTIKPQFDFARLEHKIDDNSFCLILGELCQLSEEISEGKRKYDDSKVKESGSGVDSGQLKAETDEKNFFNVVSEGAVKFKDLQGHRDCISGVIVGGGFIFTSSYDRTIRAWSLQDFSHMHTFEGHEHKVMAIVYVDQEQPLCISGDSGGGIFVWGITPFSQEPLKKWYEQKDWRYSGIHALCFSKNGNVYTGSGDRSIKAWTLQDDRLACTMNGHKSVVSTIVICDEVLYSGSWDGTIRLWSLSDHTPLTVLGEDTTGTVTAVFSLAVDRHMLIAAYENGSIKVWKDDVFMKSMQLHEGSIFATAMEGNWLFTGGWDKHVNVQELSGDEFLVDPRPIGTVTCGSAITALLFSNGKLFIGCADRLVEVYYYDK